MKTRLRNFLVMLLALIASGHISSGAVETHFSAGIAAYEAGQFEQAAQAFRDSLTNQTAAGTLVNLGLAEWRAGHAGAAVLGWEQATWLNPFDHAARNNLAYVVEMTQINLPDLTWFEETSTWLPANGWTWIAGGSLWLAVALVTLPGFFRWRKAGWHQTVAALALGVFLLCLAPFVGMVTRSNLAIVTEKNTSLRLTPTQAAEEIASLPPGEAVRKLRERGNYFFVHTQNGDGWIERRQISFLCPR